MLIIFRFTADPSVHVYNCSSADIKSLSSQEVAKIGFQAQEKVPLEGILWRPGVIYVKTRFLYFILVLLLHILPSTILDGVLKISGKEPM